MLSEQFFISINLSVYNIFVVLHNEETRIEDGVYYFLKIFIGIRN